MKTNPLHRALLAIALLLGACDKDAPTKPVLPSVGSGFVFFSDIRNLGLSEIYSMGSDGSGIVRLTSDSLDDREPQWSPDGKKIAYIHAYSAGGYEPNVTVMDANGANPLRLINDSGDVNPSWSPDGSKIAFQRHTGLFPRDQLWIVNVDGTSPTLVIDSLVVHEISWTPMDNFIGADGLGIVQFNTDGTGQTRILSLAPGTVHGLHPRMSPDGARIVFQWGGPTASESEIYVVNGDGTNLQRLTNVSGEKGHPVWSSDGTKIAFTSGQDNSLAIWVMNPDGSNQVRVSPPPAGDLLGDWR